MPLSLVKLAGAVRSWTLVPLLVGAPLPQDPSAAGIWGGGHVETGSWTFLVQVHEAASIWCQHARMFLCLLSISKAKMLEDLKLYKCNDQLSLGWSWCSRQNINECKLIQSLRAVPFSEHPSPWSRLGHLLGEAPPTHLLLPAGALPSLPLLTPNCLVFLLCAWLSLASVTYESLHVCRPPN